MQSTGTEVERSQSLNRLRTLSETINQTSTYNRLEAEQNQKAVNVRINTLAERIQKQANTDQQKFGLLADQLSKLQ